MLKSGFRVDSGAPLPPYPRTQERIAARAHPMLTRSLIGPRWYRQLLTLRHEQHQLPVHVVYLERQAEIVRLADKAQDEADRDRDEYRHAVYKARERRHRRARPLDE